MQRFLVFCFDGTGNNRNSVSATNVLRFHDLILAPHVSHYYSGPGNEGKYTWLGRVLGKTFGMGCQTICDHGFSALKAMFHPGDRIAVVGFSRGATIARMFADKVARDGVNGHTPTIDFLGVWDTVAAFMPFGRAQQGRLFHDLNVHPKVIQARHAVAINEDRCAFAPNLMNARDGIVEMWFRGNHADVGGGYQARGLADITLHWMLQEATACGLVFKAIGIMSPPNKPHCENLPLRRRKRRIGVVCNDTWTDEAPLIHVTARNV